MKRNREKRGVSGHVSADRAMPRPVGWGRKGDEKMAKFIDGGVAKHAQNIAKNGRGSFSTRREYVKIAAKFGTHLQEKFGLQKLKNISEKHIRSYAESLQERGLAPATIKKEMAGVRYVIQQLPNNGSVRSMDHVSNEALGLEKKSYVDISRRATGTEYQGALKIAEIHGKTDIKDAFILARSEGLRIHEVASLRAEQAQKALLSDTLTVSGKGAKIREIPLSPEAREVLRERSGGLRPGEYLFERENGKTHQMIASWESWNYRNRDQYQGADRGTRERPNMTYHSLRHAYAKEQYDRFISRGLDPKHARQEVSKLLGHERDEVTRIYLR